MRIGFYASLLGCLVIPTAAFATPVTIVDHYVGGTPTNAAFNGHDVIGDVNSYDISKMTVDQTQTSLTVSIFSTYFNNVGSDGTRLGDLFLSTNGWHPEGAAPYLHDDYAHGEWMELAAVLSDHGDSIASNTSQNYLGHSGTISLYSVQASNVQLSQADGIYRAGQEVRYNPGANEAALGFGTWSITDVAGSAYDMLTFTFNFPAGVNFGDELGFHWAMTCGNDTIEGKAGTSVPEPMSLALLGSGIGGMFLRRRRVAA